ncbi:MAG: patatin-like phospholipase family protein [Nonlabens sp.]
MAKSELKPLHRLGLCFSGGGYRATFYGLGVLSILNKIQYRDQSMLDAVKSVSSVSGGTLLAAAYTRAVQQDDYSFEKFYQKMYETFKPENDRLMERATAKLKDDSVWEKHSYKKRSIINAFALCYQEMDVYKGTLDMFDSDRIKRFHTVCFNATDFSFGLTFRFQNNGDFGNSPLFKKHQSQINALKGQIEIGDAVASSSCFPIGFAPIIFPDDFIKDHNKQAYQELKSFEAFKNGVGLMDGGVADNQGIGSMVLADKRKDGRLDLILVNDVGGNQMPPWEATPENDDKNGVSLTDAISNALNWLKVKVMYWLPGVLAILMMVLNNMEVFGDRAYSSIYIVSSVVLGLSLLATLLAAAASILKNSYLNKISDLFKRSVPKPIADDILQLKNLKVSVIKRMLGDRLSSGFTMINYVFMNQIRRLNYDLLYASKNLKNRRATAMIYELNGENKSYTRNDDDPTSIAPPSELLQNVALIASQTATTLWWSEEDIKVHRMDKLIACGQFTVCYNLLKYVIDLQKGKEDQSNIDKLVRGSVLEVASEYDLFNLKRVEEELRELWSKFNEDPMWMVGEYER